MLRAYGENIAAYLQRRYPHATSEQIRAFVSAEATRRLKRPVLKMIEYPSYGNANLAEKDLLNYTDQTIRHNIITPAGTLYVPPSVQESFLKRKLLDNMAFRKVQKKKMLVAQQAGDLVMAQFANNLQSQIKIETNSIPGAFGSEHNPLYDKAGYNAVTALARHSIMCGYAHVERMLEGNFYFPTLEHCINYCMQLVQVCPENLLQIALRYQLHLPAVEEVAHHFTASLRLYQRITPMLQAQLLQFLTSLSMAERTFVFYAFCLKTLLRCNDQFFRPFLSDFFHTDVAMDAAAVPDDIFKLNGDLLAMVSSLNADMIERQTVGDAVKQTPDGVRQLLAIGQHMQAKLDELGPLIATFLCVNCDVADAMAHPTMIRKTVIISDTDSVIFSTQSWVEWFVGKITFDKSAYAINGFVVMLITLSLEHVFARLSASFGAGSGDIYRIAMKNEFYYPLMMRTPVPKQYAGRAAVQEGFVLPKLKEDIKGLSFRSSAFCPETAKAGRSFVNWISDSVLAGKDLYVEECLTKVLEHELTVIKSVESGERTFLTTTPIRNEEDYADPSIAGHFYWKLWDQVFRPNFGEFVIPNKGYVLPLIGGGKILKDERFLTQLRAFDPSLYERLLEFLDASSRKVTRLIVPMTLKQIPEILRFLIDVRGIVYANSTPFIMTMKSLGIGYTDSKSKILLSDIYMKVDAECSSSMELIEFASD